MRISVAIVGTAEQCSNWLLQYTSYKGEEIMKKRLQLLILSLMLVVNLTACGGSASDSASYTMSEAKTESAPAEMYDSMEMGFSNGSSSVEVTEEASGSQLTQQTDRKLIRTVDMSVETKEYDNLLAAVENKVKFLGGYIENMETYNGISYRSYRSSRNANMTMRITQERLDAFL